MLRNANLRDLPITAGNTVPGPAMEQHRTCLDVSSRREAPVSCSKSTPDMVDTGAFGL